MRRRLVPVVALAVALAVGLGGCSLVDEVAEGQRITFERLRVADSLRILVGELEALDGVASASYTFDAVDLTSEPALEVQLVSIAADTWTAVGDAIDRAALDEPLRDHPLGATLRSDRLVSTFTTEERLDWLDDDTMADVQRALELLPDARVELSGYGESAFIVAAHPDAAERLLDRITGDAELRAYLDGVDPRRLAVDLRAPGLTVSGAVSAEVADWIRAILDRDLPRPDFSDPDAPPATEWVAVTVSGGAGDAVVSVELVGSALGSGPAWDGLVDLLTAPVPEVNGPGACVPLQVMYAWEGVQGSFPSFSSVCAGWVVSSGDPGRPSLVELREALAASGIDPEALGYDLW